MKIAFCFLTRANLLQEAVWERFFASAPKNLYNIYCHPKHPSLVVDPLLKTRIIESPVPTRHAHISIVGATLRLFSAALNDDADNDYFILLSESTIPLISFAALAGNLAAGGSRSLIKYAIPAPGSEHDRRSAALANRRMFPAPFYHHDQWIVLHRRHVRALAERPFLNLFEKVFAADEHYFLNVLVHPLGVPLDQFIDRRATYVNWGGVETRHPKTYRTLEAADIDAARSEECWFFRKVDERSDCSLVLPALGGRRGRVYSG